VSPSSCWRATALVAALLLAGAPPTTDTPRPGDAAPLRYTNYGAPTQVCVPADRRLDSVSGIAETTGGMYVQNDRLGTLWQLDRACRPVRQLPVPADLGPMIDTEDLAATADGSLWIADTGGNRVRRVEVSLVRLNPTTGKAQRYRLVYPDRPHDAEALLISPDGGQVLIVTKSPTGTATVYSAGTLLRTDERSRLRAVALVHLKSLIGRNPGPAAVLVTGGAVSPDGSHVVLRTYSEAWEWDITDGNIADAFRALPRKVTLPVTRQGEAITYASDGSGFLVAGEQLAPIYRVSIDRPRYAPTGAPTTDSTPIASDGTSRVRTVIAVGAIGCLLLLVGAVVVERRRSH
jgi:hypothetical protein